MSPFVLIADRMAARGRGPPSGTWRAFDPEDTCGAGAGDPRAPEVPGRRKGRLPHGEGQHGGRMIVVGGVVAVPVHRPVDIRGKSAVGVAVSLDHLEMV